jgi:hypothetical protein
MLASRCFSDFLLAMSIQFTGIHSRKTGLGRTCHRDRFGTTVAKMLPGFLASCMQGASRQRQQARLRVKPCSLRRRILRTQVEGSNTSTRPASTTANALRRFVCGRRQNQPELNLRSFGTSRSVRACRGDPSVLAERSSSRRRKAGL